MSGGLRMHGRINRNSA